MFKQYWVILTPFHRTFGIFLSLLVLYEGLQILEGYLIPLVVRLFGERVQNETWGLLLSGLLVYDELFMRLDNIIDYHVIAKHSYPIYKHLKLGAIAKFLEMDLPWHSRHNSGTLVGKVAEGVWKVLEIIDGLSWEFVPTFVQTVLSLIPLFIFSPLTALFSLLSLSWFVKLTTDANRERRPFKVARYDMREKEWHESVEKIQAIESTHIWGQRERVYNDQFKLHDDIIEIGLEEAKVGIFKYNRRRIRLLTLTRRLILATWVWQLYSGTMDIATLIFVSVLSEKLFTSFWRFARLFDRAAEASEGASRLADLLGQETSLKKGGIIPELVLPIGISLKNVSFSYEEDGVRKEVLHDFSLEVNPGSIVAIVGSSGSGKTTLSRLIPNLLNETQEGVIEVGGLDVRDWDYDALQLLFSKVPQGDDVSIFADTIGANIAFPKPEATNSEIEYSAKLAGIFSFITSLPDVFETLVGERGKKLSGGQKQRVALARAILANRPILILDEATSAVDAITEMEIQRQMRTILKGKTAIIIAHRLSTIRDADKIVVIEEGRKVEEGAHEELMALGGKYAALVAAQSH